MKAWVVVEYELVDVRGYQDSGPRYVPGAADTAQIVHADKEDEALSQVATQGGWFAVFPLPDYLKPRQARVVVDGRSPWT